MPNFKRWQTFFVFSWLATLAACSEDNFPKYEALGGLRILSLRADLGSQFSGTAEFSPGDTVVVTPYVSYYKLVGPPSFEAKACPDPGVNVGGIPSCDGVSGAVALASGTVAVSGGSANTGAAAPISVSIPADVLSARSAVAQFNGVSYIVTYKLTSSDGTASVSSFKRLVVSSGAKSKNLNPTVTGLSTSGVALAVPPTAESEIAITFPAAALESYSQMKSDGAMLALAEDLVTTYFITDGKLKYLRTVNGMTTTYTPPATAPTDHAAIIVAVTRDSRGGTAVTMIHQ